MPKAEKWRTITGGLLTVTIISGYGVSRIAPRIGGTIALATYLAAGITGLIGTVYTFKEI